MAWVLHELMQRDLKNPTFVVTNVTFKWLFAFMNCCNMLFQPTLLRTDVSSHKSQIWMSSFLHALMKYANLTGFFGAKYELQISHTKSLCFKRFSISKYIFYFQVSTTKNLKVTNELQVASNPLKFKLCKHAHALHLIPKRDHSFKTSAIFHDFWPLPLSRRQPLAFQQNTLSRFYPNFIQILLKLTYPNFIQIWMKSG